ncbi:MAG: hypothetical protein INR64_13700, partial [Caulobacteraceae bacterium]|nr:hypothetical protein [Caulobacter sp.]
MSPNDPFSFDDDEGERTVIRPAPGALRGDALEAPTDEPTLVGARGGERANPFAPPPAARSTRPAPSRA